MKNVIIGKTGSTAEKDVCVNYASNYVYPGQHFQTWLARKKQNLHIRDKCT